MQPHWPINLKNGLKVNVPADLDNPVTLTLLEYEDWPEPEFAFLRQLVQPGLRILDATAFDLIRLGASTPLDPRWLQQADPLFLLPSDSAAARSQQPLSAFPKRSPMPLKQVINPLSS